MTKETKSKWTREVPTVYGKYWYVDRAGRSALATVSTDGIKIDGLEFRPGYWQGPISPDRDGLAELTHPIDLEYLKGTGRPVYFLMNNCWKHKKEIAEIHIGQKEQDEKEVIQLAKSEGIKVRIFGFASHFDYVLKSDKPTKKSPAKKAAKKKAATPKK